MPISVVGSGLIALAVAMGIGRFAFTPLMPLMMRDGTLTAAVGAEWAAANYADLGGRQRPDRPRRRHGNRPVRLHPPDAADDARRDAHRRRRRRMGGGELCRSRWSAAA